MKQTAEHEITVRIRTRYPQEDWAAIVSDILNRRSVAKEGRIVNVISERLVGMQDVKQAGPEDQDKRARGHCP